MFSYDPLWKKLIDCKLTKTQFAEKAHISKTTLAKMGKNQYIDMSSLDKICEFFNCDLSEILQYNKNN